MIRTTLTVAFLMVCLVLQSGPVLAQDWQRGLRNYKEIIHGKKNLQQLSPQEQQEVFAVMRQVELQEKGSKSSECRDAIGRAESAASELADYARRLRNCAEAQDYSDDCDTEFRRTRSAHDDYESAVSSFQSYCN